MTGEEDLTRLQAIDWCRKHMADFHTPVYPPPNGWMWAESGEALILTTIFTITDQADITAVDVGMLQAGHA